MKKRRILIIIAILVAVFLSFMIGTGFTKRTDVALGGYSVSEDGKTLTFQAGVTSSMGYTRGFKDNGGGVKPHYLTFYSTFGKEMARQILACRLTFTPESLKCLSLRD